jgi:hypothetical protein
MKILPFVEDYWKRFARHVYVYDNGSDDGTIEFLSGFDWITVEHYETGGQLDDLAYLRIKNNEWKGSDADWVVVCDVDECVYSEDLFTELQKVTDEGCTLIKPNWVEAVSTKVPEYTEGKLLHEIVDGGILNEGSKTLMFRPKDISEIRYEAGCHECRPIGKVKQCRALNIVHCKNLGVDYVMDRFKSYCDRMCENNKKYGYGFHYFTKREEYEKSHADMMDRVKPFKDLLC